LNSRSYSLYYLSMPKEDLLRSEPAVYSAYRLGIDAELHVAFVVFGSKKIEADHTRIDDLLGFGLMRTSERQEGLEEGLEP